METILALFNIDWPAIIAGAIASGIGISAIAQLLKSAWIKIPARANPRIVTASLSILVGVINTIASGVAPNSLTNIIVFAIVSFIVSGVAYDSVKGLVAEVKDKAVDAENTVEGEANDDTSPPADDIHEAIDREREIEQVAIEVIKGQWGAGSARRDLLKKHGFDFDEVQAKVKEVLAKKAE